MRTAKRPRPCCRGFTLIDMMIAVTIISIIAAIALPKVERATEDAKTNAMLANIREFNNAYRYTAHELGSEPISPGLYQYPAELADTFPEASWDKVPQPIEGQMYGLFQFDMGKGLTPTLTIEADDRYEPIFTRIDTALDDGNPATGDTRINTFGGNTYLVTVIVKN